MCSSPDGYGSISSTYISRDVVLPGLGVGHLEDALGVPDDLPFGLDCCGVVSIHKLGSLERAGRADPLCYNFDA